MLPKWVDSSVVGRSSLFTCTGGGWVGGGGGAWNVSLLLADRQAYLLSAYVQARCLLLDVLVVISKVQVFRCC